MTSALLWFCLALLSGLSLLRYLPLRFYWPEYFGAGCIAGFLLSGYLTLGSVCLLGYQAGTLFSLYLLGALCAFTLLSKRHHTAKYVSIFSARRDLWTWLAVTLVFGVLFARLFFTHMLWMREGAFHSGGSTWGDLALHLSLISRFANQDSFTWDLSIYSGAKLSYPFLFDFISGILHRQGWNLQWALIAPSFLVSLALVQVVYFLTFRWIKSSIAGSLALVILFANGSSAGLYYFLRDWQTSQKPLHEFLLRMTKDYANLAESNLYFSNLIADCLLPQRGILLGLATFVFVVLLLYAAWDRGEDRRRLLSGAAALTALLPLAHVHTFLVVFGLWGWLAFVRAFRERRILNDWTVFLLIGIALAAPQIAWQLSGSYHGQFSHWHFGWMKKPTENIFLFWLRNMGIGVIFLFGNFYFSRCLWKKDGRFFLHFYTAMVMLFIIANLYIFQPYVYDNLKFIVFTYLAMAIFISCVLTRWSARLYFGPIIAVTCFLSLTLTGVLSIIRETSISWQFLGAEEIAIAEKFKAIIPRDARILTSDQHNHFVPTLTGRRIVMGYRGWLWTHGIQYWKTERDVMAMFAGGHEVTALFKEYDVSYLVTGPSERSVFKANESYFDAHYPVILRSKNYKVYDVRTTFPNRALCEERLGAQSSHRSW